MDENDAKTAGPLSGPRAGLFTPREDAVALSPEALRPLVQALRRREHTLERENDALRRLCRDRTRLHRAAQWLCEQLPLGDVVLTAEGVIVRANGVAADLLGSPRGALTGASFTCSVTAEQRDLFASFLRRVPPRPALDCCTVTLERPDGGRCAVQVLGTTPPDVAEGVGYRRIVLVPRSSRGGGCGEYACQEAIRHAASFAAKILLRTSEWPRHVHEIIERLGQAAQGSWAFICENVESQAGELAMRQCVEWVCPELHPPSPPSVRWDVAYRAAGLGRWLTVLGRGEVVAGLVTDLPSREGELLAAQGLRSIVVIPVFAARHWWGVLGLAEARYDREWSAAEIDSLKTATGTLGAAIHRQQTERALVESEQRYRSIFHGVEVSIWEQDYSAVVGALQALKMSGSTELCDYLRENHQLTARLARLVRNIDVNRATLRLFEARDRQELVAATDRIFASGSRLLFVEILCTIATRRFRHRVETRCQTIRGRELTVLVSVLIPRTERGIEHVTLSMLDITERKQYEEQIWRQAKFDTLTGLASRNLFMERLEQSVNERRRKHRGAALLFIDLDRFKWVNDHHGHAAGDELLRQVAGRLRCCVRESDLVTRLGGDEFTIILPDVIERDVAASVASKLLAEVARPFHLDGDEAVVVSASVGITFCPRDADNVDNLLRNADIAMYRAKADGANTYRFYGDGAAE